MDRTSIINKLKETFKIIVHNSVDVNSIDENANIMLDLGVNSIGLIYMAMAIHKQFNVDMSTVSIDTFKTVKDVVDYLQEQVK